MQTSSPPTSRLQGEVIGTLVDVLSWDLTIQKIFDWAKRRESRSVCFCNVHSVVTATRDTDHANALSRADMVAADGAPVAWALRSAGHKQQRISGPDVMLRCCELAAETQTPIFFFGSTEETLKRLTENLRRQWPDIKIAGYLSPPFRPLSRDEDAKIVQRINDSGAAIVWVGLGCPKQEAWIAEHLGSVKGVMIGVGAAFDFHAGIVKRAPLWMQRSGLEWLHRLSQDPRRLARRYATTNTRFILALLSRQSRRTVQSKVRTLTQP